MPSTLHQKSLPAQESINLALVPVVCRVKFIFHPFNHGLESFRSCIMTATLLPIFVNTTVLLPLPLWVLMLMIKQFNALVQVPFVFMELFIIRWVV